MSKFSLKNIFIKSEEDEQSPKHEENSVKKTAETGSGMKFPGSTTGNAYVPPTVSISEGILNQVVELYEKGFDSLNKPGYDFYEFFKAIHSVNDFSPGAYKMAFQMGKVMNASLEKNALIQSADQYISEINKVHENYRLQGEGKRNDITKTQTNEKQALTNEIASIENQINQLKNQIAELENKKRQRESELSPIDTKYHAELKLIEEKLQANNSAREIITSKINTVKHGILTNI
ncbi:MAG: hypothetical protein QM534_03475 [Sediminibacterium sp.]|nr:hypothetical protein [Sediminibacterium sp.]